MPEGFIDLTPKQQSSFVRSFLLHLADVGDVSDFEPVKVEPVDDLKVKVIFNSGKVLHYKDGEWDE